MIQCPFEDCEKEHNRLNSFTSHLTKKHKPMGELNSRRRPHEMEEGNPIYDETGQIARRIDCSDDDGEENVDEGPNIDDVSNIADSD